MRGALSKVCVLGGALWLTIAMAQAEKVTVEVDNAWVHVSRVNLAPHERLPMRQYPATVVVYLADGNVRHIAHKDGDTAYFDAGARVEENDSDRPFEEVIIELKPGAPPLPHHPVTLDPVKLDPQYHKVDFENERVRVLRTLLAPHIKSPMHEHPRMWWCI